MSQHDFLPFDRRRARMDIRERLAGLMQSKFGVVDYDPLMRAVEIAEGAYADNMIAAIELVDVHLKVASYCHAKRRAVELTESPEIEERKVAVLEQLKRAMD